MLEQKGTLLGQLAKFQCGLWVRSHGDLVAKSYPLLQPQGL